MKTAIWWIRRDLRLADNPALEGALASAENVVPVFVLDPGLLRSRYNGEKRTAFLLGGLKALDRSLRERGSRLVLREGDPERELGRLKEESGAEAIFAEQDVSPYARRRDRRIAARLPLRGVWGVSVLTPRDVLKTDGVPYTTFTPYSRTWARVASTRSAKAREAPARLPTPGKIESLPIPDSPAALLLPGEDEAVARLERFARGPIFEYAEKRNRLDLEGTSGLSPYLRFGMISARRALAAAEEAFDRAPGNEERESAAAFRTELVWREFYLSILYHFPEVRARSFRPETRNVAWRDDEEGFRAWCEGKTGYPVVDAGMRQLSSTGLMHNRARMVTAAFLTKHLLIDWRRGEEWFMRHLLDGDPAANNGGWQWSAGTGTDAAPYFRIFNPMLQGKRFDPEGAYVSRFVAELAGTKPSEIHEPRNPIVSHTRARVRALAAFKAAREPSRKASVNRWGKMESKRKDAKKSI
jgi:deoxyribodipyrimidine photo-lyase